jgi:hypothetical protein
LWRKERKRIHLAKNNIFMVVTPCRLVEIYRLLGGAKCFHRQCQRVSVESKQQAMPHLLQEQAGFMVSNTGSYVIVRKLLDNIAKFMPIARQRLGKHIPAERTCVRTFITRQRNSKHYSLTIEVVFSVWSLPRNKRMILSQGWHPCGGGFEQLHRDPVSRRKRRKGKSQI